VVTDVTSSIRELGKINESLKTCAERRFSGHVPAENDYVEGELID
jgi:hypothetical protein